MEVILMFVECKKEGQEGMEVKLDGPVFYRLA